MFAPPPGYDWPNTLATQSDRISQGLRGAPFRCAVDRVAASAVAEHQRRPDVRATTRIRLAKHAGHAVAGPVEPLDRVAEAVDHLSVAVDGRPGSCLVSHAYQDDRVIRTGTRDRVHQRVGPVITLPAGLMLRPLNGQLTTMKLLVSTIFSVLVEPFDGPPQVLRCRLVNSRTRRGNLIRRPSPKVF